MEFSDLKRPVEKWPVFVKVNVWMEREDDGDKEATGEILISVCPNDEDSDGFATITSRMANVHGAQIEATQTMASLGYLPAPGRVGRWHPANGPLEDPDRPWIGHLDQEWNRDRIFRRR